MLIVYLFRYFYTLILGIKLSLMQQGLPVRLNANEMFERACHVPYESWDAWIYEQIDAQK